MFVNLMGKVLKRAMKSRNLNLDIVRIMAAFMVLSVHVCQHIGVDFSVGAKGGTGNVFNEEMAKYNVVPGDIYVLCHSEYGDDAVLREGSS